MSDHLNDQLANGIRMVTGLLSHDSPLSSEELAALNRAVIDRQGQLPTRFDELPQQVRDRLDPRTPLDPIRFPTVAPRGIPHPTPPATDEFYSNA
jgi:hypothetical protein